LNRKRKRTYQHNEEAVSLTEKEGRERKKKRIESTETGEERERGDDSEIADSSSKR
jgi:hypothetical protein